MKTCELTFMVNAISCSIANCVSKEDLPLVAAVFSQIAATLASIVVQNEIMEKSNAPAPIIAPPEEVV
jgi:hypothetical protein